MLCIILQLRSATTCIMIEVLNKENKSMEDKCKNKWQQTWQKQIAAWKISLHLVIQEQRSIVETFRLNLFHKQLQNESGGVK